MTQIYKAEEVEKILHDYIMQEIAYDQPDLMLTSDIHLVEKGIVDSMDILRLINFIEEQFGFDLAPEDLMIENFSTIDAITQFVLGKTTRTG